MKPREVRALTFRWVYANGCCSRDLLPIEFVKASDMSLETKFDGFHSYSHLYCLLVSDSYEN